MTCSPRAILPRAAACEDARAIQIRSGKLQFP